MPQGLLELFFCDKTESDGDIMLWEELSAKSFPDCIKASGGVCVLPVGVLEKHGNHLPVGTDMFTGQAVCKKAAELETAVVFPYYFFGQIAEARHFTGTISASHRLIMDALLEMCDEIHRNGFDKIIIVSSHGGNGFFLPFFAQQMPELDREYSVYTCFVADVTREQEEKINKISGGLDMGMHAGLSETAVMMHLRPELVNIDEQNTQDGVGLDRLRELNESRVYTGFNWYADYPNHIAGDHTKATPELGKVLVDEMSENIANIIRKVKADDVSAGLVKEYAAYGRKPK